MQVQEYPSNVSLDMDTFEFNENDTANIKVSGYFPDTDTFLPNSGNHFL